MGSSVIESFKGKPETGYSFKDFFPVALFKSCTFSCRELLGYTFKSMV